MATLLIAAGGLILAVIAIAIIDPSGPPAQQTLRSTLPPLG
jgi:hypothetical protein